MVIKKILLTVFGKLKKICLFPIGIIRYFGDLFSFISRKAASVMPLRGLIPMFLDRYAADGSIDKHYFYRISILLKKSLRHIPICIMILDRGLMDLLDICCPV